MAIVGRPDYSEWWPTFSIQEMEWRLRSMPFVSATLLVPENIEAALFIDGGNATELLRFLELSERQKLEIWDELLRQVGFNDRVIHALLSVPRAQMTLEKYRAWTYINASVPSTGGSSLTGLGLCALILSQWPRITRGDLAEIGIGSGYLAAAMANYHGDNVLIHGYEISDELREGAHNNIKALSIKNVIIEKNIFTSEQILNQQDWHMTTSTNVPAEMVEMIKENRDDGIVRQLARQLSAVEYLTYAASREKWPTYRSYKEAIDAYLVLETTVLHDGVEFMQKLYGVTFVPFRKERNDVRRPVSKYMWLERMVRMLNLST